MPEFTYVNPWILFALMTLAAVTVQNAVIAAAKFALRWYRLYQLSKRMNAALKSTPSMIITLDDFRREQSRG